MQGPTHQSRSGRAWALAARQHGVVARRQLLELGLSRQGIARRVASGRLHLVMRGVYAVGRPELTRHGRWMAAVLACGPGAALSHGSAAALWRIGAETDGCVEISVRASSPHRRPGIHVHRRPGLRASDVVVREGIPVTSPVRTLVDQAGPLENSALERAVNEADKRDLTTPEKLRAALEAYVGEAGVARLRTLLDRRTFRLSDSKLELMFRPLARDAGLPTPLTKQHVNGFEVDFYWPDLGLVIETDGLRYHRTPAEQARDRLRDQAHIAAGLTPLRFTHEQVRFESAYVRATLATIVRRLEQADR